MKFRYKKFGNILRPVIPIKVFSKSNPEGFGYEVLVDSGADLCIFHAEIGEALGIKIKTGKPQEVFGVGGKVSLYYLHKISISVGGWAYNIDVGFMPNVSGNVMQYGLVGQKGFFDKYIVKFDLVKSEVELKERN
ncbi:MAG: aspartyl protease family protein [bacterium]